jgi:hypothetical protein
MKEQEVNLSEIIQEFILLEKENRLMEEVLKNLDDSLELHEPNLIDEEQTSFSNGWDSAISDENEMLNSEVVEYNNPFISMLARLG